MFHQQSSGHGSSTVVYKDANNSTHLSQELLPPPCLNCPALHGILEPCPTKKTWSAVPGTGGTPTSSSTDIPISIFKTATCSSLLVFSHRSLVSRTDLQSQVDDVIFNIHRSVFLATATLFNERVPSWLGWSEHQPVQLRDVRAREFSKFLSLIYPLV